MKSQRLFIEKSTVIINFTLLLNSPLKLWILFAVIISQVQAGTEEDSLRVAAENYGAPLTEPPSSEITAMVMEEFRFPCRCKSPITWVTIDMEHHHIVPNLHIEYSLNNQSHFIYEATLVFRSVSVDDVSFYYCIHNQSLVLAENKEDLDNEVNNFRAVKSYLFVRDEAHPLVPINNPVLSVKQFEPYTIPCKPSSKDVEVEIVRLDDEHSKAIASAKYDEKLGFTTRFREIHDSTWYLCRPKGQSEPEIMFEITLLPSSRTDFITSPNINSTSEGGFVNVESSITLFCYVEIKAGVKYDISWFFKGKLLTNSNKYDISGISEHQSQKELSTVGTKSLTILNVDMRDAGNYKCSIRDHNDNTNDDTYTVNVLERHQSVLELITDQTLALESYKGATVSLVFKYKSYPNATFEMLKDGHRLIMDERYELNDNYKQQKVIFRMKDVHVDDTANYTLVADNGMQSQNETVQVLIRSPPIVVLEPKEIYAKLGTKIILNCQSVGYPAPQFDWSYRKCDVMDEWEACTKVTPGAWPPQIKTDNIEGNETESSRNIFTRMTNLSAFIKFPGISRCIATNDQGFDMRSSIIMVGDLDNPTMLWRHNEPEIVAEGDTVRLECGAIKYNYSNIIQWKHDGKWLDHALTEELEIEVGDTQYSHRSVLVIKNVDLSNSGQYVCVVRGFDPSKVPEEVRYHLSVLPRKQARVVGSNLTGESIQVSLGDQLDMYCDVDGVPPPEIMWTKDDELLKNNSYNILITKEGNRSFAKIVAVKVEHEGRYKCAVSNKDGRDEHSSKLIIKNRPFAYLMETTIVVVSLILFLCLFTIYLCCRVKKEKATVRALKKIGLANFEEGDIDRINPELDLNEQADLLPYDRRFEFPRDKVKLGQQLGAGAFGVVIKGIAQGIIPYEEETTVAVKMVKANTDDEIMRALVTELKIMVHLGQHLNVVNLLGAVTKNIARREMMVIVEYCRFGNVQKFLLKHRTYFVDQIKKDTDEIDTSILENEYRWSNNSVYNLRASGGAGFNPSGHINSQGYVRHSGFGVDSANTEATLISRGDESERPLSSAYQSEYKGPVRSITTSDLVCWSFQVARGMDYLASRKVLHGDLAARNILLCDNNIVKICDFGLARSLYNNENYKKNNETPLPFKWLALESLSDQVFSTYSDIWAFGVTMWEFFSLAQTPYPGIDPNRDLYLKLLNGYRMDKPKYANQKLYDIMLSCWNQKPETRPLFSQLEKQLSALMEDGVKDLYVDLNEPYLQANAEYLKSNPDYLAMLGPPDHMAPSAPMATHEEFHVPDMEAPAVPGYLNMKPKQGTAIYTPSSDNGFDIEDDATQPLNKKTSPVQKPPRKSKERQIREENEEGESIPMLEKNRNHSNEREDQNQTETDLMPRHPRDTMTSNQYVNVPSATKPIDAFSNPSYIAVRNVNERT